MINIKVQNLKSGMVLAKNVYALNNTIVCKEGTILNDEIIKKIKRSFVNVVVIEDLKDNKEDNNINNDDENYEESYEKFNNIMKEVIKEFKEYLNDIAFKNAVVSITKLKGIIEKILASSNNDIKLLDNIVNYHLDSDVIYKHSINVAIIGYILAKWLSFSKNEIELVGVAGLLHDIGKLKINQDILNKKGELSKSEIDELKKHTNYGYDILNSKRNINKMIALVALTHHERSDGSGYPIGFNYSQISKYSKVIAIADTYEAMISPRPYRQQFCIFEAFEHFENQNYGQFDSGYLSIFSSKLLEYYLDNYVVLNNGKIGKIVAMNRKDVTRPIIYTSSGVIDLLHESDDIYIKVVFAELTNDVIEASENTKNKNFYNLEENEGNVRCQRCNTKIHHGRFCNKCIQEIMDDINTIFENNKVNYPLPKGSEIVKNPIVD